MVTRSLPAMPDREHPYTLLAEIIEMRNAGGWWRKDAACIGHTTIFFPGRGGAGYSEMRQARQVCASCPVRQPCLDDAMSTSTGTDSTGVRGGLSTRERRRLRTTTGARP